MKTPLAGEPNFPWTHSWSVQCGSLVLSAVFDFAAVLEVEPFLPFIGFHSVTYTMSFVRFLGAQFRHNPGTHRSGFTQLVYGLNDAEYGNFSPCLYSI